VNRLALKMLFGDRAKYVMLISGITFATLLMASSAALFTGLMMWTTSLLHNVRAPVWVADPKAALVNDNKPLRDTDVNRVRSVEGVAWAVPIYQGISQAHLLNGGFQLITIVGLDAATLIGAPTRLIAGRPEDLRLPNSIIIDDEGVKHLSAKLGRRMGLGDIVEINDHEAKIVCICKTLRSLTGGPYVFTTYERAIRDYVPPQRKLLSFVLAAPKPGISVKEISERIHHETGLAAYSEDEFMWSTIWWYVIYTHIPVNVGTIVIIGFLVGIVISGQTFYSFVLENTRALGALKAMGTSNARMAGMLVVQSLTVGIIGFGLGMGMVTINGVIADKTGELPFLLTWHIPVAVLLAVLSICVVAADRGVQRMSKIDSASVFR